MAAATRDGAASSAPNSQQNTLAAASAHVVTAFSDLPAHRSPYVVLSPDGLSATVAAGKEFGWVRSKHGACPGSGLVRWGMQLGVSGGRVYRMGVVSDAFTSYNDVGWPRAAWVFQNDAAACDGELVGEFFQPPCFEHGDVVCLELERRPGCCSVMRVRVQGRAPLEMRGLPEDGVLYPAVCLINDQQNITMVLAPLPVLPLPAAASPATSPTTRAAKRVVFAFSDARSRSGDVMHRSPHISLSFDCLTATVAAGARGGWVRAEHGVAAGCGVVRWAVQLGQDCEGAGRMHMLGVASEKFNRYSALSGRLSHLWVFHRGAMYADGRPPLYCTSPCFSQGDLVTLELERRWGAQSVLRLHAAARAPQEITALPEDGVLYPIVCMLNDRQRATMVPLHAAQPPPAPAPPPTAPPLDSTLTVVTDAVPCHFVFSSAAAHKSPHVNLSDNRAVATLSAFKSCGWVRGERGAEAEAEAEAGAGGSVMRWAIKLGRDDGGTVFVLGVVSDQFCDYNASIVKGLRHLWAFENAAARSDGRRIELPHLCFHAGDTVALELERRLGLEGVLRARAKGRTAQELRGLPAIGALYPVICIVNDRQKVAIVPVPYAPTAEEGARESGASSLPL